MGPAKVNRSSLSACPSSKTNIANPPPDLAHNSSTVSSEDARLAIVHDAVDAALPRLVGSPIPIAIAAAVHARPGARFPTRSHLTQSLGCAITAGTHAFEAVLMPGPSQDREVILHPFMSEILAAVEAPSFLPSSWPKHMIRVCGGIDVHCNHADTFRPDGSLLFRLHKVPWLVLEVAVAEATAHVKEKLRVYLLGTRGRVRYGICIDLFTRERYDEDIVQVKVKSRRKCMVKEEIRRLRAAAEGAESKITIQEKAERNVARIIRSQPDLLLDAEDKRILERDGKYVLATASVYTSRLVPLPTGKQRCTLVTVVDSAPVWPQQSHQGFHIRWSDIGHPGLPACMADAMAFVSFAGLHEHIQILVDDAAAEGSAAEAEQQLPVHDDSVEVEVSSSPTSSDVESHSSSARDASDEECLPASPSSNYSDGSDQEWWPEGVVT
ncbi:hypothetical protein FN846DRAFT_993864 [Sphaerosporella brunnea]|uniref:Uncharacterized protein n=1 Tax=Sphaerosporella brunnea TaxID=1250544 RepID=A0A5J5EL75_9PEZI|nr:hypothetical protein FN846DRAFT_993864 [Sphaerosporella brunnea]